MTHICVSKLTIIGSDNGLTPDRRQAIIWTNVGMLSIGPLGTKLSEILIAIHLFSFKKMHLKMSSGKWRPCCLGLKVFYGMPLSDMNNVANSWQGTAAPCNFVLQWRIMSTMASQITSVSIVFSIVCSGTDQRKHRSSASLAFVLGIHRWPVIPRTKGQ